MFNTWHTPDEKNKKTLRITQLKIKIINWP